jgi:SAM-dependent methyltransferase
MDKANGGRMFGVVSGTYDNVRPSYPVDALAWALEGIKDINGPVDIVDVGAGTGKLTSQLALLKPSGSGVQAVEPDPEMLRVLTDKLPGVVGHLGTGEATGLPDSSVDVVTVAQAFHWMEESEAFAEFARILRPGGRVILIWNDRDGSRSSWNETLSEMMRSIGEHSTAHRMTGTAPTSVPGFSPAELHQTRWAQSVTPQDLLNLVQSRSYVIALSVERRDVFLEQVRVLMDTHPDLAGKQTFELPYLTSTFRYTRL